jgi:hypothetical protein
MSEGEPEPRRRRDEPPPLEFFKPGETPPPTTPAPAQPAAWVPRPEEFERPSAEWTATAPRPRTRLPQIAGILLVAAGALGIASNVAYLFNPLPDSVLENLTANMTAAELQFWQLCGLASIYAQGIAILGGVLAFRKASWRLVIACGTLSVLCLGFVGEASALGLMGLLVVLASRREFAS